MRRRILCVVGTRPNFMKTAPVIAELRRRPDRFELVVVHTGQHYDTVMSTVFFEQLGVGPPDIELNVGPGTHAAQTARVMERLEPVLCEHQPDVVLVPGDVNSTLGAALVACKLGIAIGHIEAGLRSFDRTMPEEINRVLTDQMSDYLFVHSPEAVDNLVREGCSAAAIHPVGNTMIDTLLLLRPSFDGQSILENLALDGEPFLLVTLHRPALVDGPLLDEVIRRLIVVSAVLPVVFPAHPRTRTHLHARGLDAAAAAKGRVHVINPLGYLDFMGLVSAAAAVITDSGGLQEETTVLGIPCFTLRENTERPITITEGTNTLLGLDPARIVDVPSLMASRRTDGGIPEGWDGYASERLVAVLERIEAPLHVQVSC